MFYLFRRIVWALLATLVGPLTANAGDLYDLRYSATLYGPRNVIAGGFAMTGQIEIGADAVTISDLTCRGSNDTPAGPQLSDACAQIEGTTAWRRTRDGTLDALAIPGAASAGAATLLKGLISAIPLTLYVGESWQVEEPDTVGLAQSAYQRKGDRIERRRTSYSRIAEAGTLRPVHPGEAKLSSQTSARIANDRVIEQTSRQSVTRSGGLLELPEMRAESELHLLWSETRTQMPPPRQGIWQRPYDPAPEAARRRAVAAAVLSGRGLEDLLPTLSSDALNSGRGREAFVALSKLLAAQPDTAPQAADICRSGPSPACHQIIQALGDTGAPQAQTALRNLFAEFNEATPEDATLKRNVVRALGTQLGADMTTLTRGFLIDLLDNPLYARQAAFGLGAEAYRKRGTEAGDLALAPLLSDWTDVSADRLRALGNAGTPQILPELARLIETRDPLATIAIRALRRMPSHPRVDVLFLKALTPTSQLLHRTALENLSHRSLDGALLDRVKQLSLAGGSNAKLALALLARGSSIQD